MTFLIDDSIKCYPSSPLYQKVRKLQVDRWEVRTCTQKYYDDNFAQNEGPWKSKGKDHRRILIAHGSCIARRFSDERLVVDFNEIEDLAEMIEYFGDIEICLRHEAKFGLPTFPRLEITLDIE